MKSAHVVHQRIAVEWDFPVVFTHGLFQPNNPVLVDTLDRKGEDRRHRAMVFVDSHVAEARPGLIEHINGYVEAARGCTGRGPRRRSDQE
jgi:3-dehydroquinate synthase